MAINRKFFFDYVRSRLFDGALNQQQVQGMTGILDEWEESTPNGDDRWLAYMLGTVHHETGRTMQPVRETLAGSDDKAIAILENAYKKGKLHWVKKPYWRRDGDGKSWLGRGLVQLTHKTNYQRMSTATGVDIVSDPARAMTPDVAVDILFIGMKRGSFTGRKLADYFSPTKQDWVNARRIINGLDRAQLVASYAKEYYASVSYTTG